MAWWCRRIARNRHQLNRYGKRRAGRRRSRNARNAREPWLLAASPALRHLNADAIVSLYAQRMRIEQSFRDTKNLRCGLGLEVARLRSAARLEMLLLLIHLAAFVQRLIGEQAHQSELELQFTSTRRARREISVLTLGRRILDETSEVIESLQPWNAIPSSTRQAAYACGGLV